eukprot:GHVL01031085.1.p1 GENE.GHVL01031085.1~~GHVL01031085.1.p1  ORF type:complete len:365 (+),score=23.27 GHVL01031085.1:8-1102(+)
MTNATEQIDPISLTSFWRSWFALHQTIRNGKPPYVTFFTSICILLLRLTTYFHYSHNDFCLNVNKAFNLNYLIYNYHRIFLHFFFINYSFWLFSLIIIILFIQGSILEARCSRLWHIFRIICIHFLCLLSEMLIFGRFSCTSGPSRILVAQAVILHLVNPVIHPDSQRDAGLKLPFPVEIRWLSWMLIGCFSFVTDPYFIYSYDILISAFFGIFLSAFEVPIYLIWSELFGLKKEAYLYLGGIYVTLLLLPVSVSSMSVSSLYRNISNMSFSWMMQQMHLSPFHTYAKYGMARNKGIHAIFKLFLVFSPVLMLTRKYAWMKLYGVLIIYILIFFLDSSTVSRPGPAIIALMFLLWASFTQPSKL